MQEKGVNKMNIVNILRVHTSKHTHTHHVSFQTQVSLCYLAGFEPMILLPLPLELNHFTFNAGLCLLLRRKRSSMSCIPYMLHRYNG